MFLTILLSVIIISVLAVVLIYFKPQFKTSIQIAFSVLIVILGYFLVSSIMQPIKFNKERIKREDAVISKLKDIRTLEVAYKDKYGVFASSFDTLIAFVKTDSFGLKRIVQVAEWNQDTISEDDAIKAGILRVNIEKIAVKDSLFTNDYPIDDLSLVPFCEGEKFHLATGEVSTGSKIWVKVFEASVLYDVLLKGLDPQMVINYKDERYNLTDFEGLKVGSLTKATNNSGNWEK
jgi:hypothetical protein